MSRLTPVAGKTFDLVIIGGGIVGAGIARDAALRGLSVALFERADYGGGTTSGSTRLIHGGLRYLEMFDFKLVRLDLREREILLRIAPHLVKPREFLLPFYDTGWFERTRLRIGLWLYDALSYDKTLPSRRMLTRDEVIAREPQVAREGLQGAASYYDAQARLPERLCLENVLDACARGAQVFNYAEVTGPVREGDRIVGVRVRDRLAAATAGEGAGASAAEVEVRGRVVVNASGPWFDRVEGALTGSPSRQIRTTKGIHIAVPSMTQTALALASKVDGRLVFAIPWLGYTWIGTTDTDFDDDPATVRADAEDVDYLLRSLKPYLPGLDHNHIFFTNAGVRALVKEEGSESSVSRLHAISDEAEARRRGVIEVLGGKLTGYRAIAEEVTDLAARLLNRTGRNSETATVALPGAQGRLDDMPQVEGVSSEAVAHLQALYGTRAREVLQIAREIPEARERLASAGISASGEGVVADSGGHSPSVPPDIAAQVILAVRTEHAVRLVDVMLRRTSLGFSPDQGQPAAAAVAAWMARELGWSAERTELELADWCAAVARTQQYRTGD